MTTERHLPSRKQAVQQQSLRDYWMQPTGFAGDPSREVTRRTAPTVITPSLWEQPPMLPSLVASSLAPVQERAETLEAETLEAETTSSFSGNETVHLRQRVQRRGVETLSTAELLSLLLRPSAGNEQMKQRLSALLAEQGGLRALLKREFGELSAALGEARAAQLQATLEVARRLTLPPDEEPYTINSPADAAALVRADQAKSLMSNS